VQYQDATPSNIVTTANEMHVPVGRTIHFELQAADVIHSFWVPNLHGKTDLIPGHTTHTFIRADAPGEYWGQCAEFCGFQHANMRFVLIAEPEEDFQRWLAAQRQPAAEPATESQKKGQQVFLTRTCVMCHTITGTPAASKVGPDLTHIGSRPRIGAGTLPNTRGNLAGWVSDPHGVKPGVRMPPNPLEPDELRALLDYLESLK
jgi:cytochrome c oxidase subunit 2